MANIVKTASRDAESLGGKTTAPSSVGRGPKQEIADKLAPRIVDVRQRRRPIDEEDLRAHAMQHGVRGRYFYNSDTFRHYIPMGRRAIERFVVRVVQSLIPNDQFMECYPGDEVSQEAGRDAATTGAVMHWLLTRKIGVRKLAGMLTRCLLLYRRAIVKTSVVVTDASVDLGKFKGRLQEVWPTARVVDPFSFYVWPETSPNLEDASLVFEDVIMPYAEYREHAKKGRCDFIAQSDLTRPQFPYHHVTRLSISGFAEPQAVSSDMAAAQAGGKQKEKPLSLETEVSLTEAWFYSGDDLMTAWIVWNVHDSPRGVKFGKAKYPLMPYRLAVARPLPGETYSTTLASDVEPLQILLNDQFNQMEEARSVSALPPIALDPNLISRTDSIVYGSRKRWLVENPKDAIYPVPLPDTSKQSLGAAQNTMGLINTIGGASPLAEGQPTRGLPRAGQAVQNLISLGLADITDVATIIETELLTPMMADLHRLLLAFTPESQILRIPGTQAYQAKTLTIADIMGNWNFQWVGAQQLQAISTKSAQLLNFFAQLAKIAPTLEQQGWGVKFGPLVKRVWRDGLGERGVEDIVVPLSELLADPQVQMARKQALQQQQQQHDLVQKPKVSVNIRGEVDTQTAVALAEGQTPAPQGGGQPGIPGQTGAPQGAPGGAPTPAGGAGMQGMIPGGANG